ncbi:hypothetical protein AVEN_120225-1 [Araneus ventricosus]|uniref:RNase H type-1 domain-containing protein n=1 Tax=Araneus ventricosus TaxID=182803 RepID=A0A4Y2J6T6_ARAVE|nr:hypothetical protein AVEN_120225-1 [Araneus ventricosus]
MLYKTVIEKMLRYGAAVGCLDSPVRIKRKLNTIQRSFLRALTGAYRTTANSALQVILGISPFYLYLQLQREARVTAIRRLNTSLLDTLTLVPGEVEEVETGWAAHPAECPTEEHISLVDGWIYTDGSKTEKVFQSELLALKHATDHETSLPHQSILVDNQASVQAAANPRSRNTTAREICQSVITNKHMHISWIKAHVGYDGNEEADRLEKEAAESDRDPLSVKAPIFLPEINLQEKMEDWQSEWEDEDRERLPMSPCLMPLRQPNRLR